MKSVFPAKAGIQFFDEELGSGFRRNDERKTGSSEIVDKLSGIGLVESGKEFAKAFDVLDTNIRSIAVHSYDAV